MRLWVVLGLLAPVAAGCSRKAGPANDKAAASSSAQAPNTASAVAPTPARPGLTEQGVRELVRKWAAAQSGNDFAGYEALYAERFTGVKRAGSSTTRLDRKGWMADRKTMITPGLVVEANEVSVNVSQDAATAHFVQRYKSPRFEDVGPKQLVVILTAAGPRIAREEMLSSSIQLQGLGKPLGERLHRAVSTGVYLVAGIPESAGAGERTGKKTGYLGVHEVDAKVTPAALTSEQRGYVDRTFTAYDADGKPCAAVVKELSVKALVTPHFGVFHVFEDKDDFPNPKVAQRELSKMLFGLAGDQGRYLFGHFATPCPGALWAIEGSAVPVVPKSSNDAERTAALAAFRALPAYRKLATDFASQQPAQAGKRWEDFDGELTVAVFRPEKGAPRAVVGARGGWGCGEFWGTLSAVFDSGTPGGATVRGVVDSPPSAPHVLAAVDLDADGELEFITGPDGEASLYSLLRPGPRGTYVSESFFQAPYLDCPC